MNDYQTNLIKSASRYIKHYGPLTRESERVLQNKLRQGDVSFSGGMTPDDAQSVIKIVKTWSLMGNKQLYETGNTDLNPTAGTQLLSALKTMPRDQLNQIYSYAGLSPIANTGQPTQQPTEAPQNLTGADLSNVIPPGQTSALLDTSDHPVNVDSAPANVTMRQDGKGGTRVSTMNNGDGRAQRALIQSQSKNDRGKVMNTAASIGS